MKLPLSTKSFIMMVIAIMLGMVGVVGLAARGIEIPLVRQFLGFILLTFIPGLLIMRMLKLRRLGSTETLLYTVGLSIASVMVLGLFMNAVYPYFGISRPISTTPLLVTIAVFVAICCLIIAGLEKSRTEVPVRKSPVSWRRLLSAPVLFLVLVALLSILGALFVYITRNNIFVFVFLAAAGLTIILIVTGKFIPRDMYPAAVFMLAVGLQYHISLVSVGLGPFDINLEYNLQKSVLDNAYWSSSGSGTVNAMLSIVILAPIYSLVLNTDTLWIFKIVYPLIFSLVPVALYQAYRTQVTDKIAFCSVFLFMSWASFFGDSGGNPRQAIAELFLALSMLIIVRKKAPRMQIRILATLFGLCLAVSHYGTSYLYMLLLLMALPMLRLFQLGDKRPLRTNISGDYVALFCVASLSWYMSITGGATFQAVINIGKHVQRTFASDLLVVAARDAHVVQALGLAPMRASQLAWDIARIFQYITQVLIVVGIIESIIGWRKARSRADYIVLSWASMVVLAFAIVIPYVASAINMTRIYHLMLFTLAPFCILGGMACLRWLSLILRLRQAISPDTLLKPVAFLVLIPYFLFNTGFIFELAGATPTSMPLSMHRSDWAVFSRSEIRASRWLAEVSEKNFNIYGDAYAIGPVYQMVGGQAKILGHQTTMPDSSYYVFLRYWNIAHGEGRWYGMVKAQVVQIIGRLDDESAFAANLRSKSLVYDNGWARVLGPR